MQGNVDETDSAGTETRQEPKPAAVPELTSPWKCSICSEPSRDICVNCTKDACENHLCPRCRCCSDCCTCEVSRVE